MTRQDTLDGFCELLAVEDFQLALSFLGDRRFGTPDLIIAPDGLPYLYRWHIVPRNGRGNVYFHIQIASDPERPMHDHPWDNTSVILAGGYKELLSDEHEAQFGSFRERLRHPGDVVNRKAQDAHRLILPDDVPYTMSLFSTGPHRRAWGFWVPVGTPPPGNAQYHRWYPHDAVTEVLPDGRAVWKGPPS